jgi:hypothetical protein
MGAHICLKTESLSE